MCKRWCQDLSDGLKWSSDDHLRIIFAFGRPTSSTFRPFRLLTPGPSILLTSPASLSCHDPDLRNRSVLNTSSIDALFLATRLVELQHVYL